MRDELKGVLKEMLTEEIKEELRIDDQEKIFFGYRQALIDTRKIIEDIFDKSIDFYDRKLEELKDKSESLK